MQLQVEEVESLICHAPIRDIWSSILWRIRARQGASEGHHPGSQECRLSILHLDSLRRCGDPRVVVLVLAAAAAAAAAARNTPQVPSA